MKRLILISVALFIAFGASQAAAFVVYSNPYDPNSTNAFASATYNDYAGALVEQYCYADYYWDGSYDITDFHWWGVPEIGTQISGFTVEIWSHDAGSSKPGSLMYSEYFAGDAGATFVETNANYGYDVFKYGIDLTTPFSPGVADYYWFSVYADVDISWWYWAMSDGPQFNNDWAYVPASEYWEDVVVREGDDFAFELTGGDPIPEPATMVLVGLGLLGMAARRKFKK